MKNREYRLFLASSKDLKDYRDQFEVMIRRKNDLLYGRGVYLNLFVWEEALEAVAVGRKQEEYNEEVEKAHIFVLLFRERVGKYTREEFERAFSKFRSDRQPLIFLYKCPTPDGIKNDDSLTEFFNRMNELDQFPASCDNPNMLRLHFEKQLDLLFNNGFLRYGEAPPAGNEIDEKIFFCDRQEQSRLFDKNIQDSAALQFALITGHERDVAEYFVRRKEIELDGDNEMSAVHLQVRLANVDHETFEDLEDLMRMAIRDAWKKHTLLKPYAFPHTADYTIPNMLQVLEKLQRQYLLITWKVRSFFTKQSRLADHVAEFYRRYAVLNSTLPNSRKIFFIGIVSYTDTADLSWEQFQELVRKLQFGKIPIPLTRINVQQIKDWMEDYEIELNPDIQASRLSKVLPDYGTRDSYYMSELEEPLGRLLRLP